MKDLFYLGNSLVHCHPCFSAYPGMSRAVLTTEGEINFQEEILCPVFLVPCYLPVKKGVTVFLLQSGVARGNCLYLAKKVFW